MIEDDEKKTGFTRLKEFIKEDCWWRLQDFWKNYIWPAYHLRNYFFNRYDIVKMPEIKRCEYSDVVQRVLWANVELLKFFIEKEKPEEHVEWYGDWGHKYIPNPITHDPVLFPEYEGKYIMDLMKMTYKWFTEDRDRMNEDRDYLLDVWYRWLSGRRYTIPCEQDPEARELKIDESTIPTDLSFFDDKNMDWEILDRYLDGDRMNLIKKNFIFEKLNELENKIEQLDQKHLHLIIECRFSMWT